MLKILNNGATFLEGCDSSELSQGRFYFCVGCRGVASDGGVQDVHEQEDFESLGLKVKMPIILECSTTKVLLA